MFTHNFNAIVLLFFELLKKNSSRGQKKRYMCDENDESLC